MATIKGIWKFNEIITFTEGIDQTVNFSVGTDTKLQEQTAISVVLADQRIMVQPAFVNVYRADSGWSRNRVFDFGETEQEVSDEFAQWLFQNANNGKITLPATDGNTKVLVKENGTTTLATAGTYCATDIDVNVEVEDKSEEAFEAGKKSEYDAFWDEYQDYGQPVEYAFYFGLGWNDTIFRPKYNLIFRGRADQAFFYCKITNLKKILEDRKLIMDTSQCTNFYQTFGNSKITHIPTLDLTNANSLYGILNCAYLVSVDNIILKNGAFTEIRQAFNAKNLESINFTGSFYNDGLIFTSTVLNKTSITSIVNALSDTTTNLTVTLSLTAVNNAFETTEGAADGSTSEEWLALTETKSNWTISLV